MGCSIRRSTATTALTCTTSEHGESPCHGRNYTQQEAETATRNCPTSGQVCYPAAASSRHQRVVRTGNAPNLDIQMEPLQQNTLHLRVATEKRRNKERERVEANMEGTVEFLNEAVNFDGEKLTTNTSSVDRQSLHWRLWNMGKMSTRRSRQHSIQRNSSRSLRQRRSPSVD